VQSDRGEELMPGDPAVSLRTSTLLAKFCDEQAMIDRRIKAYDDELAALIPRDNLRPIELSGQKTP
jgi:hypothetical protein